MDTTNIKGLRAARLDRVLAALAQLKQPPAPKPPLLQRFLPTV